MVSLWLFVAAILVLAGWAGARDLQEWFGLSAARARTAALGARMDSARAAQAAQAASAAAPPAFGGDARRWMALSALDSAGVLRSLESAQVAGAKVVSVEIDGDSRLVALEVEVSSADVATSYLEALNAGADRPTWMLSRLQVQRGAELAVMHGQLQ